MKVPTAHIAAWGCSDGLNSIKVLPDLCSRHHHAPFTPPKLPLISRNMEKIGHGARTLLIYPQPDSLRPNEPLNISLLMTLSY